MRAIVYIFTAISILVVGCQSGSTKNPTETTGNSVNEDAVKKEIEEIIYPLPTAFELTQMLTEIEASYIFGITNDPAKAETYFEASKQALNLGIYSADIAYAITYNMKQEVNATMSALRKLVNELDLNSVLEPELVEQVKQYADDKDKLVEIISGLFNKMYAHLLKGGRESLAYEMLAGSWIEGLYITNNISETTYENPMIVEIIMKQEPSLDKLINLLKKAEDESLAQLTEDLMTIQAIYKQQEGSSALSIAQLTELISKVEEIRAGYIK